MAEADTNILDDFLFSLEAHLDIFSPADAHGPHPIPVVSGTSEAIIHGGSNLTAKYPQVIELLRNSIVFIVMRECAFNEAVRFSMEAL